MSKFSIGNTVKYTEYALRPKRDAYLSQGQYTRKQQYKQYYEEMKAARGIVIGLNDRFVTVECNGAVHKSMFHMWEIATN